MKIAICFFGYPRFYDQWKNTFGNFYDGCDVDYYAHFWKDSEIDENKLLSEFNFKDVILEKQKKNFVELPESTNLSKITKSIFETLSPLYSLKRLGEIIKKINILQNNFFIYFFFASAKKNDFSTIFFSIERKTDFSAKNNQQTISFSAKKNDF